MVDEEAVAVEMKMPFPKTKNRAAKPTGNRRELLRMPPALPQAIARRLQALSARLLHVSWIEGVLWAIAALYALVLVQGALDWLFDLPQRVRVVFLLADAAILGFLVFHFGVQPWRRRLTPDEAALYAERHWPELRTGLISAVQLARRNDGSPAIVAALMEKMAARVARFDLRVAVQARRLRKLVFIAVALAVVAAGVIAWFAPKSFILLRRMVLINEPLPTETIVMAVSKDIAVATGQTIELAAKASGVIPRSGRVEVTYEGKKPEMVSISPKASSPEEFSLSIANVQQPLKYRFYLNDGRGEEWNVTLLHPPVLEEISFEVVNPPYTEIPATRLTPGSLNLLAGSKLRVVGKSSQALKSAKVVLAGLDKDVPLKPEGSDRTEFRAEIDVPKEGLKGLHVELTNEKDMVSQDNTNYGIEVIRDAPPEIVIAEGQPDKQNLVSDQKPRLRFDVRDDFKVKEVFLCVQAMNSLGEGEEPNPEKAKQVPITVPKPAAGLSFDYLWTDVQKAVDWAEGLSYTYWIKAVDNNDVTGPGVTYSAPMQWSVVSLQTKRAELAEQLKKHAESIKDLSGAQEDVRKELGELLKQEKK
jgi:hypothetical protein